MDDRSGTPLDKLTLRDLLRRLAHPGDVDRLAARDVALADLARPGFAGGLSLVELHPETRDRLEAAFELARRRALSRQSRRRVIRSAEDVVELLRPEIEDAPVEVFCAVLLDARNRVMAAPEVSRGTLSTSLVHPREVLRPAVLARSAAIIVAHNHPSGDPAPSAEDHAVTRRLAGAAELMGIPLLDHVIVGDGAYHSYRDSRDPVLGD